MTDLIEYVTEKIKEDVDNAVTERQEKEANFKVMLLVQYEMYKKIANGDYKDSSFLKPEKFDELAKQYYILLIGMATMVYDWREVQEAEYYERLAKNGN